MSSKGPSYMAAVSGGLDSEIQMFYEENVGKILVLQGRFVINSNAYISYVSNFMDRWPPRNDSKQVELSLCPLRLRYLCSCLLLLSYPYIASTNPIPLFLSLLANFN